MPLLCHNLEIVERKPCTSVFVRLTSTLDTISNAVKFTVHTSFEFLIFEFSLFIHKNVINKNNHQQKQCPTLHVKLLFHSIKLVTGNQYAVGLDTMPPDQMINYRVCTSFPLESIHQMKKLNIESDHHNHQISKGYYIICIKRSTNAVYVCTSACNPFVNIIDDDSSITPVSSAL